MNAIKREGYCQRCGTRLARGSANPQCGPCEQASAGLRAAPPEIPYAFWDTDQLRDALAARHMGRVVRAYRKHPHHIARYGKDGISQELLGGWFSLTQAQISRIETGPPIQNLDTLAHWARTLRIPSHLLWFRMPGGQVDYPPTELPFGNSGSTEDLDIPPEEFLQLVSVGNVTRSGRNADMAAMRAFRSADLQVGGGHLYATVLRYLQADMGPRLFGGANSSDSRTDFTAAAALTEMAGWMAHDAGRDKAAKQHFERSLVLVQVGGDLQLGAHILGSMSHLANHLNQPNEAISLAKQGRAVLQKSAPNPGLEARLLAMEARGLAAFRETADCAKLLIQAEGMLGDSTLENRSPWVSRFDLASLASEAARCMRLIGDWPEAQRQAEQVIYLRSGNRTRSRAFGQLALVAVLLAQGQPDVACAIAQEVIDSTQSLGSFLVIEQLLEIRQALRSYNSNVAVGEFLICLDDALRERLWLYQWLTKDGRKFSAGPQEGA